MEEQGEKNDICFFAETDFRGQHRRFGILRQDRPHHIYLIGKTGMGKSTVLENLIFSDLYAGAGLALLDPHGDLVKRVLSYIPESRRPSIIYVDPSDLQAVIPFNILKDSASHPYLIVSGIVGAFKKVWGDSWGPRMEHILRHALLALLRVPEATLLDLPRILVDKEYRARTSWYVDDPQVRAFFKDEFEKYSPTFRTEAISPILNKVGHFLANPFLRKMLGHKENQIRVRDIMDEGKVLLVNLSKGKLGEDSSALLGALLLSRIELAALSRADVPIEQRRPFYLFVDEFSNFATPSFAGMLSESRKFGLSLTTCSQTLGQMEEDIRGAVFGNVGTLIAFQVGAEDAEYLEKEFAPTFSKEDLINLARYQIYLKLMIEGRTSQPFSAVTLGPPESAQPKSSLTF